MTSWPDIASFADARFVDAGEYLARVEAICMEMGMVPNSATLFARLRYAGHWLSSAQRRELSARLRFPLEPAGGIGDLWGRKELIEAVIVACRNNSMRLPVGERLVQIFGNAFRVACLRYFNGYRALAKEAKKIEPYLVLRDRIFAEDGSELQSEQERRVYNGLFNLLGSSAERLRVGVRLECGACPDIVIDDWLIVEVMMFDWGEQVFSDDVAKRRLVESYLERNRRKRDKYIELGHSAIFVEPSSIACADYLADALREIVVLVERGSCSTASALELKKSVHGSRRCQSLKEVKILLEPLYEKSGFFPTTSSMRQAGLVCVEVAIRKIHGGSDHVAAIFGWPLKRVQYMPRGYFDDFENVRKAVMALVPEGTARMPSQSLLREKYRPGLLAAIYRRHGGLGGVAKALGLEESKAVVAAADRVCHGTWNDYEKVLQAVRSLLRGNSSKMPSAADFHRARMKAAYLSIISRHGGLERVASDLGLEIDGRILAIRQGVKAWHRARRTETMDP